MGLLLLLVVLLIIIAGITAIAAAILAVGTLLAHVFRVTAFEASVVVALVFVAAVLWIRPGWPVFSTDDEADAEEEAAEAEPAIIFSTLPRPPRRVRRQRRHP